MSGDTASTAAGNGYPGAPSQSPVTVAVRVRPLNMQELKGGNGSVVGVLGNALLLVDPVSLQIAETAGGFTSAPKRVFRYDYCYGNDAKQDGIYSDLGRPILDHAFAGINCSMFAYGQTGSGKSYTMMGASGVLDPARMQDNLGIIPRLCRDLFRRISEEEQAQAGLAAEDVTTRFSVKASYLEIYCERVRDLFALEAAAMGTAGALAGGAAHGAPGAPSPTAHNLRVREHPTRGAYVEGLTEVAVKSYEEVEKLLVAGSYMRTVAETRMNPTSSRSHALFTLHFTQTRVSGGGSGAERVLGVRTSKIVLVDLAGSERADTLLTGGAGGAGAGLAGPASGGSGGVVGPVGGGAASGPGAGPSTTQDAALRMREMTKINTSLSALGAVIKALSVQKPGGAATGKEEASFVPYRNSVLTWLLRDSLGGNSKTTMVATVAPADGAYSETLSTLKYCESVKKIVTTTVINDTAFGSPEGLGKGALPSNAAVPITDARADAMLADLRREVAQLRRQLAEYERAKTETERLSLQRSKIETALSRADAQRGHFPLIGVVGGQAAPPGTPAPAAKGARKGELPFSPAPRAPPIPGLALETPAHTGSGSPGTGAGGGAATGSGLAATRPAWTSPASKRGSPASTASVNASAMGADGVLTLAPPAPVTVSVDLASMLSLPQTPGSSMMAMSGAFTASGLAMSLAAPAPPTPDRIFGIAAAALAKSGIHVLLSPPPRTGGVPRVDRSALRPAPVVDLGASTGSTAAHPTSSGEGHEAAGDQRFFASLSTTGGSSLYGSTAAAGGAGGAEFGALLSSPVIAGEGGGPRGAGLDRLDLQSPSTASLDGAFRAGNGAGGTGAGGAAGEDSLYDLDDASVRSFEEPALAPAPAPPAPAPTMAAAFVDLGASTGSFYASAATTTRPSAGSTLRLASAARLAQEGAMGDPFAAATALGMSSSGAALYASAAAAGGRLAGAADRIKAGLASGADAGRVVVSLTSPAPVVRPLPPAASPSTPGAAIASGATLSAHLAAAAAEAEQAANRARAEERAACAALVERERAAASAEANVLRAGLTDLEARAAAAEQALAAAVERAAAAEGSVLSLTTRLRFVQEEQRAGAAAAGERCESLVAEVQRLSEALAASEAARSAAVTEAARSATEAAGQSARLKHLEAELAAVVTRAHESAAAVGGAEARARVAESRVCDLERLVAELKASLGRRGEELEVASKAATSAATREAGLQAQIKKLQADAAEAAEALSQAKAATAAAAASASTEAARAAKAEAEARIATGRVADAEAHAAVLASKASELRADLDGTRAKADQLELQLTARAITADEAASSLARERTSLASMRARVAELEGDLARATASAAAADARATGLAADADGLRRRLSACESDLARRDTRCEELSSELTREMARAAAKERELLAQAKALREANDADAAATAREVGRFSAEFGALRTQVAELHEAMSTCEAERDKAAAEAAALRRDLGQVRESWLATLRERDAAGRDRDMLRLQVKVLEARVGRVCEEAGVVVPPARDEGSHRRSASPTPGTAAWLESEERRRLLDRLKSADHRAETLQSHVEALMTAAGAR